MSEAAPTKKAFEEEQLLKAIQTLIDLNVQEQTRLPDGKRVPPMQRVEMGEKVFGEIERVLVVPFFLAVMEYFPTFYATKPFLREWASKSGLKLHHILAQSFLCWYSSRCTRRNFTPRKFHEKNHHVGNGVMANHEAQINAVQNDFAQLDTSILGNSMLEKNGIVFSQLDSSCPLKEEIEAEVEPMEESLDATGNPDEANSIEVAESQMLEVLPVSTSLFAPDSHSNVVPTTTPRILSIEPPLTDEQRWAILRCLIPIDFPVRNRFLKLAMQSLLFTKEHIPAIVDLVLQMAERGQASFSTLYYCMKEQDWMNHVKKPTIIIQAILRGPLTGDMVEFFLKNRDEKFRAEAKKLILHAEEMTRDPILFETSVREWAHTTVDQVPTFDQFCSNLNDLMRDLRKEPPRNNQIDPAWARHAMRRAVRRFYVTKEFNEEQMNDILHSILVQRPEMKSFVLGMLSKEHNDDAAFTKWRKFYPQRNDRTKIRCDTKTVDLYTNEDGYLVIPRGVNVYYVNNVLQLQFIRQEIAQCEKSDYPIVGLDAEWDSYVMSCRACLLQIAFRKCIYLVDLESMRAKPELTNFIQDFFASQKFTKIGFQFSEDLLQIRNTISHAPSLYQPENVVCIGRLIEQLLQESSRRPEFNTESFFQNVDDGKDISAQELNTSAEPEYDELEGPILASGSTLVLDDEDERKLKIAESKKVTGILKRMGLSAICKRVLGKNLEKSEQCSVWDRRPLRSSQVRYAALDAYCILMLYDRCVEWANKLGININDLLAAQSKINCPLPLFWDEMS